jgi:hypothetical protein
MSAVTATKHFRDRTTLHSKETYALDRVKHTDVSITDTAVPMRPKALMGNQSTQLAKKTKRTSLATLMRSSRLPRRHLDLIMASTAL